MRQLTIHLYCKSQLKSNLRNNTPCQCYFLYTNYVNDIKMCTLGSERISRPKRQIIERPDSSIPLPMMCTFFSVRSPHIFNSSLFNHITFKKFLGFFFSEKKLINAKIIIQCQITTHLLIVIWHIRKLDLKKKTITFLENSCSFYH